jgi:hypothetical protein
MALLTLMTELPEVNVIGSVTRSAIAHGGGHVRRIAVASLALQFCVRAAQGKARSSSVIELPHIPSVRRMALAALLAHAALVHVLLCMAVDTLLGGLSKLRIGVAARAGNCDVQSE